MFSTARLKSKFSLFLHHESGFTLIEILIAITLMSIVAVVSVPSFRKFNQSQELNNASSDLVRILKQAQSSSMDSIGSCSSGSHNSWRVKIASNQYKLVEVCSAVEEEKYAANLSSRLTISVSTCSLPIDITFTNTKSSFTSGCSANAINFTITDDGTSPAKTKIINVIKDGAIKQN